MGISAPSVLGMVDQSINYSWYIGRLLDWLLLGDCWSGYHTRKREIGCEETRNMLNNALKTENKWMKNRIAWFGFGREYRKRLWLSSFVCPPPAIMQIRLFWFRVVDYVGDFHTQHECVTELGNTSVKFTVIKRFSVGKYRPSLGVMFENVFQELKCFS